jgi:hypothetical protein
VETVQLNFHNVGLYVSNLGGQGGQGDAPPGAPQVIHYVGVGALRDGTPVDLVVSNGSEYRAWAAANNGLKAESSGSFGVVNVLAPRDAGVDATYAQLRFAFVNGSSGGALTLGRTRMTFCALPRRSQPHPRPPRRPDPAPSCERPAPVAALLLER